MSAGELSGIELQPRDVELLRGLFESRVMTLAHVAALYFDGKKEMAKKRIQKLKAAGFVRERPRRLTEPSILFLTRKAFQFLHDGGHISDYPIIALSQLEKRATVSALTLRHELEVMDVKTAMTVVVKKTDRFHVAEFSTWPLLYQFKACRSDGERVTVKPDGFIRIEEKEADGGFSEHAFFLEVDRGSEALDRVVEKCIGYRDYQRTGGFAVFCGGRKEEYRSYPFRVLVVGRSEERRDNLANRLLQVQPPFSTMILIATQTDCVHDPLGEIWMTAAAIGSVEKGRDSKHEKPEANLYALLS